MGLLPLVSWIRIRIADAFAVYILPFSTLSLNLSSRTHCVPPQLSPRPVRLSLSGSLAADSCSRCDVLRRSRATLRRCRLGTASARQY